MQQSTPVRRAFLSAIIQAVLARSPARIITELRKMMNAPKFLPAAGKRSRHGGFRPNGSQLRTRTIRAKRMHASGRSNKQSRKYA